MRTFILRIYNFFTAIPFIEANLKMGSMSLMRILTRPVRAKVAAVLFGAKGVGFLGSAAQAQLLGSTLGTFAVGSKITRLLSAHLGSEEEEEKRSCLESGLSLHAVGLAAVMTVGAMGFNVMYGMIFADSGASRWLLLPVLLSVPFIAFISGYFQPILYAHGKYHEYSKGTTAYTVIETALFIVMSLAFGLEGAFWAMFLGAGVWAYLIGRKALALEPDALKWRWNTSKIAKLLSAGLYFFFTGVMTYGALLYLRAGVAQKLGEEYNGFYQVLLMFSAYYLPFLTSGIWAELFPKISRHGMNEETWKNWASSMVLGAWIGCAVELAMLVAPHSLVHVFYTKDFTRAVHAIPGELVGDFFFLLVQPCLAYFVGRGHYKTFLVQTVLYNAVLLGVGLLGMTRWGLPAVTGAYCAGNLVWFLSAFACVIYYERKAPFCFVALTLRLFIPFVFLIAQCAIFLFVKNPYWRLLPPLLLLASGGILLHDRSRRRSFLYRDLAVDKKGRDRR